MLQIMGPLSPLQTNLAFIKCHSRTHSSVPRLLLENEQTHTLHVCKHVKHRHRCAEPSMHVRINVVN